MPPAETGLSGRKPTAATQSITRISAALKTLLAALAAALCAASLSLAAAPRAAASPQCWEVLVNDYFVHSKLTKTYPILCYKSAIAHLPGDIAGYSSARDAIEQAMLAAIAHRKHPHKKGVKKPLPAYHQPAKSSSSKGSPNAGPGPGPTAAPVSSVKPSKSAFSALISKLGPQNATSVPLPLLILAGIALLLLAVAGTSVIAKRVQARRLAAPAPPPDREL